MATPAAHRATAEAVLTRPSHLLPPEPIDYTVAAVHAVLATKAGTGDHYEAAEALLTDYERKPWAAQLVASATVHAHLAT